MSASKLFGKDILITSTTNASGTTIGSISTLGGMNVNQTMLVSGALTSTADSNTIGNLFTTGGNVGFGTTAPVQRLDVNGNLNITGNFYQNGSVYSGSTQWGSTGANIYFNTGNVGIGTIFPSAKLHLKDAGSVTLLLEADHDNVTETDVATLQFRQDGGLTGMDIGIDNTNSSYIKFNTGTTKGNDFTIYDDSTSRLYINSDGDIGIGTISPHATLTIITAGNLSLTSNQFDTGKIMFGSVVSGAYNTSNLYYIQRGGITGNMNHLIIHTPNAASNGGVNFMTTNQISRLFINSSSGNVGIGKTAPSSALDVVGNILSTGSIDAGTQFLGQPLDSSTAPSFSWTGDTNTGIYRPLADTLGFVTNGTERIRVTTGGNVGIGTTSPTYTLDINENVNVFSSFNQNVLISPENGPRIYFGTKTNTSEYMVCGAYSSVNNIDTKNRPIRIFNSSGNTLFYGETNGNVGIGTTAPAYTLDVIGTIDATSYTGTNLGVTNISSGTIRTTTLISTANLGANNISSGTIRSTNIIGSNMDTIGGNIEDVLLVTTDRENASNRIASFQAGNTGNTLTNDFAYVFVGRTPSVNNGGGLIGFRYGGAQYMSLGLYNTTIGNSQVLTIDGSRNVGIRTTAPTATLDVNGTIDATTYTGSNVSVTNITVGTLRTTTLITTSNLAANNITVGNFRATGPGGTGSNGTALITGADSFGHSLYIASSSGIQKRLAFNHSGTIGNIFAYDYGAGTSQPLVFQGPGGNVGIGINSPTQRLHVDGVVSATGLTNIPSFCYINGTGTIVNPNSLLFNGSVHIDNKSGFNATTGKYTIPMTGFYNVSFNVRLNDSTASGAVVIATTRSATTTYTMDVWVPLDPANRRCASYTRLMSLISGDVIFITMSANSATGNISNSEMTIHLVSIA